MAWSTEKLFQEYQIEQKSTVAVEKLFSMFDVSANNKIITNRVQLVELNELAWPQDMIDDLQNKRVVSLSDFEGRVFHYRLLTDDLYRAIKLGPFIPESDGEFDFSNLLPVIFYLVFAIILSLWLWPIFKELSQLIEATDEFSKTRKPINLLVKKSSLVAPLTESVVSMSEQNLRFISLQRFLASTLSHDIRNPVFRIAFLVEMCDAKNLSTTKKNINLNLDEIELLTDDFIELARLEEFHNQFKIEEGNVDSWLVELVNQFNESSDKYCEIVVKKDTVLRHDQKFLKRALQNLIENAIKYALHKVLISVSQDSNNITISVEDDGPGINPEEQQKVLGLYQRGKTESNSGSGYGLGLAFVQVICGWHKGELVIERSDRLNGAKVMLQLPLD